MVGVAGKSKACLNCKRRRVKCGFELPQCLRCMKAGLSCAGYDQPVIFINRTPADPSVTALSIVARKREPILRTTSIQDEIDELIRLSSVPATSSLRLRLKALELLQKLYIPSPSLGADSPADQSSCISWIRAICELEQPCQCLDQALVAFCMAQVYVTRSGNVTYEDCSKTYIYAIQLLGEILDCEDDERLNYILAPMAVLTTCEFFVGSTDEGMQVHVKGIADVVRLRERKSQLLRLPAATWVKLCSQLRFVSILSSLTSLRHGCVTALQWAELLVNHASTDPLIQLLDLVSELPDTLEVAAQVIERPQTCMLSYDKITAINSTLHTILTATYDWQTNLFVSCPNGLYTTTLATLDNPSDAIYQSKLFPRALHFCSPEVTVYLITSWSIQLQILYAILRLQSRSDTPDQSERLNGATDLAYRLCQSMEYCHRIESGTFGPQIALYPRWVLKHYLRLFGTPREVAWCGAIDKMKSRSHCCGMGMMMFQDPTPIA